MSIGDWLGDTPPLGDWIGTVDRAHDTARRIAQRPVTLSLDRPGVEAFEETVRLEVLSAGSEQAGTAGKQAVSRVLLVGHRDHPTLADTDIRRGDRFYYGGLWYDVVQVMPHTPARFQAIAEAYER